MLVNYLLILANNICWYYGMLFCKEKRDKQIASLSEPVNA